jgi:hypothetical protein
MIGRSLRYRLIILMGLTLAACLDPYPAPVSGTDAQLLVVDGEINSTDSTARVQLSRSIGLNETRVYPRVTTASVSIETSDGQTIALTQISEGIYTARQYFDKNLTYRLLISDENVAYESDPITLVRNTPFDSVVWTADDERLEINVNSHDDSPGPKYYRYDFEETHEYRSFFSSDWIIENNVAVYRTPAQNITNCWITKPSSRILLTTTEGQSQNVVSNYNIMRVPRGDRRLWHKYSLLVRQVPLDKAAFEYWTKVSQVSESLGGLFDPIPYNIQGNIHVVSGDADNVLGYFSGGDISTRRVTVPNNQLPPNYYGVLNTACREGYVSVNRLSSLQGRGAILTHADYFGIFIIGYFYSTPPCVDCTLEGGENSEPDFMK